jgi:hypothetical protein
VDKLINDFDFRVNVFFYQEVKNQITYAGRYPHTDTEIVPTMLKVIVYYPDRDTNSQCIQKYEGA